MSDPSVAAWHEAGHCVLARVSGIDIDVVSIRPGARHTGVTILRSPSPQPLGRLPWWLDPDLGDVVRDLTCTLAGEIAEGLAVTSGRVPAPSADDMRTAFDGVSDASRSRLLAAESDPAGALSDRAQAWRLAWAFCGDLALPFLDLVRAEVRARVQESAGTIANVASELMRGAVLDGAAVDTILAVGELVDADDGRPTSGIWTPIVTSFVGDVDRPARVGDVLPWHDARVQTAPDLFVPADAPSETVQEAEAAYLARATAPARAPRRPRPMVTCVRRLVGRTRDGRAAVTVAAGESIAADSWAARRWPTHFEPA
jgi:hypothetical protein